MVAKQLMGLRGREKSDDKVVKNLSMLAEMNAKLADAGGDLCFPLPDSSEYSGWRLLRGDYQLRAFHKQ